MNREEEEEEGETTGQGFRTSDRWDYKYFAGSISSIGTLASFNNPQRGPPPISLRCGSDGFLTNSIRRPGLLGEYTHANTRFQISESKSILRKLIQ